MNSQQPSQELPITSQRPNQELPINSQQPNQELPSETLAWTCLSKLHLLPMKSHSS
jgi:hypothetical protein